MKHLSRFDIEAIADKYVQAYMALPDVRNTQIYRIDPELLLEKVLGLNVEYQHLSYDGSILGMTSFTEMGVQVFEDDDNEAFFFLDGKTVLVEKDLNFDSKLKGRKNFTLMHEGSHQIFMMRASRYKFGSVPDVYVIDSGALKGFVSISPTWSGIDNRAFQDISRQVYNEDEFCELQRRANIMNGRTHSNVVSMTLND